jgi:hypothetical protein
MSDIGLDGGNLCECVRLSCKLGVNMRLWREFLSPMFLFSDLSNFLFTWLLDILVGNDWDTSPSST